MINLLSTLRPFTEEDDPNFGGSFYSETKSYLVGGCCQYDTHGTSPPIASSLGVFARCV